MHRVKGPASVLYK